MAQIDDFKDFVIRGTSHPKYKVDKIIEDVAIEVIVQKLELILFTNKGEVLGQLDLGCDLEYYLWETKVSGDIIKSKIVNQINTFIPELNIIEYELSLNIFEGTVKDILEINFIIKGYNVFFIFQ